MIEPGPNGAAGTGPPGSRRPATPVPLLLSCLAGIIGLVLLVAAAVAGSTALSLGGVVAGSLSLGAALYWRSLLVSAWAEQKRGRPPR